MNILPEKQRINIWEFQILPRTHQNIFDKCSLNEKMYDRRRHGACVFLPRLKSRYVTLVYFEFSVGIKICFQKLFCAVFVRTNKTREKKNTGEPHEKSTVGHKHKRMNTLSIPRLDL